MQLIYRGISYQQPASVTYFVRQIQGKYRGTLNDILVCAIASRQIRPLMYRGCTYPNVTSQADLGLDGAIGNLA